MKVWKGWGCLFEHFKGFNVALMERGEFLSVNTQKDEGLGLGEMIRTSSKRSL